MDFKRDNKQTTESQEDANETKDDDEDAESNNRREAEAATEADRAREAEKQDDTEDDEEDGLHVVSSVKEFKSPTPVVTLEGTHTTATTTESLASAESAAKMHPMHKHGNFGQVMEELCMPTPSTSKVVDNVREYVKQIESRLEDSGAGVCTSPRFVATPQASAAQIIDLPRESLKLETIKGASELSFTSKLSEEFAAFNEVERMAHEEVERIVAENISPATKRLSERPDFQQVERENQEIAERFRQIMEMFDNFTKNLESLEMPGLQSPQEAAANAPIPMRRRLSFRGERSAEQTVDAALGAASGGSVCNEFYLEVHGESKGDVGKGKTHQSVD